MNVLPHKEVPMPCGKVALVSAEDWPRIRAMKWSDNGVGYARARWPARVGGNGKIVFLHRFILAAPTGVVVDHINGDPLDNRRENLQFITQSRNCMKANRRKYAGVTFDKKAGKWRLRLRIDGKMKTLGWYADRAAAESAWDAAKEIVWSPVFNPENYSPLTQATV